MIKNKVLIEIASMVDYDRGVRDSIIAGDYDVVSKHMTGKKFRVGKERGRKKVSFRIYDPHDTELDDLIREMNHDGYEPANLKELLTFGELDSKSPFFPQDEFRIAACGALWIDHGHCRTAVLWRSCDRRKIRWFNFNREKRVKYCLLAVRKEKN